MDLTNCISPFFIFRLLAEIVSSHVQLICIHHCDASMRCPGFEDSPKSTSKSKKKKSDGTAAEIIYIMKPGSDENIELGDSVPVVELHKINLIGRWKECLQPDTPGLIVRAYAPDEEIKATAEVLKTLQKQQPAAGPHGSSNLSTPPGEAEYFKGGGLMKTVRESVKRQKMHSSPVSQPLTPVTPAGLISTITVGIPLARVLAEDLTKATLKEGSPNLLKVALKCIGRKVTSESTSSHGAGNQSGPEDSTASSSRPGASATYSSAPGSSGSTAGSSNQGPNELKQEVAHLDMVVSDDNEFADDPYQIIPTEDIFTIPAIPRENLKGFNEGYLLPAEVTAFQGIYYQESGDVRPGYTSVSPFDYPLDYQGHVALKLHSGTAAYS